MEFFKDVKIPASNLREPKACEETAAAAAAAGGTAAAAAGTGTAAAAAAEGKTNAAAIWSWCFEGHRLTYDLGAPIRFKVADVVFVREEGKP